jgi:hypothetical protein
MCGQTKIYSEAHEAHMWTIRSWKTLTEEVYKHGLLRSAFLHIGKQARYWSPDHLSHTHTHVHQNDKKKELQLCLACTSRPQTIAPVLLQTPELFYRTGFTYLPTINKASCCTEYSSVLQELNTTKWWDQQAAGLLQNLGSANTQVYFAPCDCKILEGF